MNGRLGVLVLVFGAFSGFVPESAWAQADPRFAIDRFEPSERGSDWLANESLDLRGKLRPSFGYVLSYARKEYVVSTPSGEVAPVRDFLLLHLGASVVAFSRFRFGLDIPLQPYADGDTSLTPTPIPAPARGEGIGDLRLSADARIFGQYRRPITGAIGISAWAPTGQKSQWTSDGIFRVRPRTIVAGELGVFVWSAQLGIFLRETSEATMAAAAGIRLAGTVIVGPEVFASTHFEDPFSKPGTPVEGLLGVHWLLQGTTRIAGSIGTGFGQGIGAPAWRATFAIEWAPEIPKARLRVRGHEDHEIGRAVMAPDWDGDGIRDGLDACPTLIGIATKDPKTNGCPPDADADGIDDLADACPTAFGIETSDPATNGCPDQDRDKDGIPNDRDACPDDRGPADIDPRRNGCPKAFALGSRIEMFDRIAFKDEGRAAEIEATPDNEALLTAILAVVLKLPETTKVRIEGHTDNRGDAGAARKLSLARASAVSKWLVEHGIAQTRLSPVGVGPDRPIATNETEIGRKENRRIEFHLEPELP